MTADNTTAEPPAAAETTTSPPTETAAAAAPPAPAAAAAPEPSQEAAAPPTTEEQPTAAGDDEDPEKEVVDGNWKRPEVHLEEVAVVTGEEDEVVEWTHRSKLYRWNDGQWKERGIGDSKLLRDKDGKVRFLLRQERTHKIVANHYVIPTNEACTLRPNAGNDKIWTWSVLDSAEDPPVVEQFALRFATAEIAGKFKEEFERAGASNLKLMEEGKFGDVKN